MSQRRSYWGKLKVEKVLGRFKTQCYKEYGVTLCRINCCFQSVSIPKSLIRKNKKAVEKNQSAGGN